MTVLASPSPLYPSSNFVTHDSNDKDNHNNNHDTLSQSTPALTLSIFSLPQFNFAIEGVTFEATIETPNYWGPEGEGPAGWTESVRAADTSS